MGQLATTGSTFARPKNGVTRIDRIFVIDGPANGAPEPWDVLYNWEPGDTPFDLPIVDRKATKDRDGDWLLTIAHEGYVDDAAMDPVMEIDDASIDLPVEESERFEVLAKKFGPIILDDDEQFKGFPRRVKDGTGMMVKNPYFGVRKIYSGNLILRVTFGLRSFQSAIFKNRRKIDSSPLVPVGTGSDIADLVQEGESWLKKSIKGQFRGNGWQFTVEWACGKWGEDLYAPTA